MKFVLMLSAFFTLQLTTPAPASETSGQNVDSRVLAQAQPSHPQETLRGVVAAMDERGDRITVRIDSAGDSDFKVQDGLVFNAIHNGDRVEITVENIGGAKTIVGLKKL
jgi:Cu/Ag efflux protein CusF